MRWFTRGLLLVNLLLVAGNLWVLHRNHTVMVRLREVSAIVDEVVRLLPPHPCGSVITPGERCQVTNDSQGL